mmetsp:Transcript_23443/g.67368  ORF Transcript_23443/g.67368 Transcript_23443/m.67368 type:complete len:287 (-) Transcript_23443:157-1017(-)
MNEMWCCVQCLSVYAVSVNIQSAISQIITVMSDTRATRTSLSLHSCLIGSSKKQWPLLLYKPSYQASLPSPLAHSSRHFLSVTHHIPSLIHSVVVLCEEDAVDHPAAAVQAQPKVHLLTEELTVAPRLEVRMVALQHHSLHAVLLVAVVLRRTHKLKRVAVQQHSVLRVAQIAAVLRWVEVADDVVTGGVLDRHCGTVVKLRVVVGLQGVQHLLNHHPGVLARLRQVPPPLQNNPLTKPLLGVLLWRRELLLTTAARRLAFSLNGCSKPRRLQVAVPRISPARLAQ